MNKKIHIIGICGTFMGGIAKLAKELGFEVQGSDQNTYPPMSTQLSSLGITLFSGYKKDNLDDDIDIVIVGNTISRGNPELEQALNAKIPYTSGAQWLAENVLHNRWVLAISGTHGKTTTSSLLAWILQDCGYNPGFLIGGVPENFGTSARLGDSHFFVIEADEYDTAFSDKRSKFVHYHPNTLVINNLEFDHADIFDNLRDIQTQFHHLIKTIPENGQIIYNATQTTIQETINMGCWSEIRHFSYQIDSEDKKADFKISQKTPSGSQFHIEYKQQNYPVSWDLIGDHNLNNAIAGIAAAHHVGVPIKESCNALSSFKSVKRRLEFRGEVNNIHIYDDFAHHPTAIKSTIEGLRANIKDNGDPTRLIAIIEARSNTMKMGVHKDNLTNAVAEADLAFFVVPKNVSWDTKQLISKTTSLFFDTTELIENVLGTIQMGDHILIMSNGSFDDIHNQILDRLQAN